MVQKCEKCGVTLRTQHENCPLCHGVLTGSFEEKDRLFPTVSPAHASFELRFMQWLSFGALAVCIICVGVNYLTFSGIWWSGFVVGAALCTWIVAGVAIAKRRNILKSILWQMLLVIVLSVVWDHFTGRLGWSLAYVLPLCILAALVSTFVLALAQRMTSPEYMIYLLLVCAAGGVPLLLLCTGRLQLILPSVICAGLCLLTFAALLIFRHNALRNEFRKKFHL